MDIRDTRALKTSALRQLEQSPEQKRIVLIYTGITLAVSALVTLISYCLNIRISQAVGLSSLSSRSFYSALQTMLPIVQMLFLMCLDLGYINAMLRISRGQYASPNSLRLGFDRFWPLLRCTLLKSLIYAGISIAALYLGMMLCLLTPVGSSVMDVLLPLATEAAAAGQTAISVDDATYSQLVTAMAPCLLLCGIAICIAITPISYRFRMVNYILIDRPACRAWEALRESSRMMKGNCFRLFRLDVSLWWYYAAIALASAVCYGDQILPLLGISLPVSAEVGYFGFYVLFLVLEFGIYYFLRNRVEVTYALAYDAVKPEEKQDSSVVLGNIFQM